MDQREKLYLIRISDICKFFRPETNTQKHVHISIIISTGLYRKRFFATEDLIYKNLIRETIIINHKVNLWTNNMKSPSGLPFLLSGGTVPPGCVLSGGTALRSAFYPAGQSLRSTSTQSLCTIPWPPTPSLSLKTW